MFGSFLKKQFRFVIVEDSMVYRAFLRDVIETIPGATVVGEFSNGKIAVENIGSLKPDIVTLDIDMPVMDGMKALEIIRKEHPDISVLMISAPNRKSAQFTLEALRSGAIDFIVKPTNLSRAHMTDFIFQEIQRGMKAIIQKEVRKSRTLSIQEGKPEKNAQVMGKKKKIIPRRGQFDVVLIGISTGGPIALETVISQISAKIKAPILIVQHMPALFTSALAGTLGRVSSIPVVEATEKEPVKPGKVYIAAGGRHMIVTPGNIGYREIRYVDSPPVNYCRPSVDVLFQSAVKVFSPQRILSVIMTGMGVDGKEGVQALSLKGAYNISQSPETCVVYGMPRAVIEAGLADEVLPLDEIASRIMYLAGESG